jgi:hypothetical protein
VEIGIRPVVPHRAYRLRGIGVAIYCSEEKMPYRQILMT